MKHDRNFCFRVSDDDLKIMHAELEKQKAAFAHIPEYADSLTLSAAIRALIRHGAAGNGIADLNLPTLKGELGGLMDDLGYTSKEITAVMKILDSAQEHARAKRAEQLLDS